MATAPRPRHLGNPPQENANHCVCGWCGGEGKILAVYEELRDERTHTCMMVRHSYVPCRHCGGTGLEPERLFVGWANDALEGVQG